MCGPVPPREVNPGHLNSVALSVLCSHDNCFTRRGVGRGTGTGERELAAIPVTCHVHGWTSPAKSCGISALCLSRDS